MQPASLLQLMWLASPALPVGGFSYSEGLEAAVESGHVTNATDAAAWLLDQLRLNLGRADLPVMASAFGAWQRNDAPEIAALNDWVRQTRETSEMRQQTEQMGRSLLEWLRNGHRQPLAGEVDVDPVSHRHRDPGEMLPHDGNPDADAARLATLAALQPAPTWPVAFALAALQTGAPLRESLLCFAFGWAENMVQATMKSVPLGQIAGQRVLAALAAAIPQVVETAMALPDDDRQAFTPMLAILSAQHETQYSRLFRS